MTVENDFAFPPRAEYRPPRPWVPGEPMMIPSVGWPREIFSFLPVLPTCVTSASGGDCWCQAGPESDPSSVWVGAVSSEVFRWWPDMPELTPDQWYEANG